MKESYWFIGYIYPNPSYPFTAIEYSLPKEAYVIVEVYDRHGRIVETLVAQYQQAGTYRVIWDARDRASELSYYKITINAERHSRTHIVTFLKSLANHVAEIAVG